MWVLQSSSLLPLHSRANLRPARGNLCTPPLPFGRPTPHRNCLPETVPWPVGPDTRFGVLQVDYLSHLISKNGVAMELDKIKSVLNWPIRTTAKGIQGFLGFIGYYQKFVKGFRGMAAPLTQLLKKDRLSWNDEATTAFA
ncbi:hypothetical protein LWI28_024862 [Acer negundo]|uniref:Mitochondrial protein n=1 Tax=Acer negundo TaxID=4023 RepID=A0AAD5JMX1_ACENE|nr:hypothetical protein LWI28_024862 [Acer negundo]